MEALRDYLTGVIVTVLLAGLLQSLLPKGGMRELVRLFLGAAVLYVMMQPLTRGLPAGSVRFQWETSAPDAYLAEGENLTRSAMTDIISERSEAYILDKAAALGVQLKVYVTVSDQTVPVPVGAVLKGEVSPYIRKRLEEYICSDLGIAKENLQWMP